MGRLHEPLEVLFVLAPRVVSFEKTFDKLTKMHFIIAGVQTAQGDSSLNHHTV